MVAAAFLGLVLQEAPAGAKPAELAWLEDRFIARRVVLTPQARSFGLLEDGLLDVRVVHRDGAVRLVLLQPGSIVALADATRSGDVSAHAQFVGVTREQAQALSLAEGEGGAPRPLVREVELVREREYLVRTIRPVLGGGGAAARVVCTSAVEPSALGFTSLELAIDALTLDRAKSLLPRRDPGFYEQGRGARQGVVTLYPLDFYGHPSYGTFDVLSLDRDHLEWSGGAPRDLECSDLRTLRELRLPPQAVAAGFEGTALRVTASRLGFTRVVEFTLAGVTESPPSSQWRWKELKAPRLLGGGVPEPPVTVLDPSGEPVQGAWVCARSRASSSAVTAPFFTVQTDVDGRVRLPVDASVRAAEAEVLAFEAGARARFGSRIGAVLPRGAGGECVVLLDRDEECVLKVDPPPGFATPAGLQLASGSFLAELQADGTLHLPATGDPCVVRLGAPYVEQSVAIELVAKGEKRVVATFASGRERRVRFVDARDGEEVRGLTVEFAETSTSQGQEAASARPIWNRDGVFVPPERAGTAVRFKLGFMTRDGRKGTRSVEIAAEAPRDQDLLLEPD